jgi:Ca2+-binding RTX toxin-like protein
MLSADTGRRGAGGSRTMAMTPTEGDDILTDTPGSDTIDALGGDDRITVTNGSDTVAGGTGIDTLVIDYAAATARLLATSGPNAGASGFSGNFSDFSGRSVQYSGIERFHITTGSGDDEFATAGGDDEVRTGLGNDVVHVGRGFNIADGGGGEDGIGADFSDRAVGVTVDLRLAVTAGAFGSFTGFEYFTTLAGSAFRDVVIGTSAARNETFLLGDGDDEVTVFNGNDIVAGGAGIDTLVIDYSAATARLVATSGPTADASGFSGNLTDLSGRSVQYSGIDRFNITTGSGNDEVTTASGDDTVSLGAGDDFVDAGSGLPTLDGGAGIDGVSADLSAFATNFNWLLDGANPDGFISGLAGASATRFEYFGTLIMGAGNNQVTTKPGIDRDEIIFLGAGDDAVTLYDGNDRADGGDGVDTLTLNWASSASPIFNPSPNASFDLRLSNGGSRSVDAVRFERLAITAGLANDDITGTAGNDTLVGWGGSDILRGGNGDDFLIGDGIGAPGPGADTLIGGAGNDLYAPESLSDIIVEQPNEGVDEILANNFASYSLEALPNVENLRGAHGSGTVLRGNGGNNYIYDLSGADTMIGLGGDDTYLVDNGADVVTEQAGEGLDTVRTALPVYALAANVERLVYTGFTGATGLRGNGGDNEVLGAAGDDALFLQDGGADMAVGGDGSDGFYFGNAFGAGDIADGGAGTDDQLALQGAGYSALSLGAGQLVGIETLALLSGGDTRFGDPGGSLYSYAVTTHDGNVVGASRLTINANGLAAGEALTFDGSAETDGSFAIFAGFGPSDFTGGAGSDGFFFGDGRFKVSDRIDGGGGADDQLGLRGDYSALLQFQAGTITGIETIALISSSVLRFGGGDTVDFSYNLATHDANVASGARLIVTATGLEANESLSFDGSAELDGLLDLRGGAGNDNLRGGAGADLLWGGLAADVLTGGGGGDAFTYTAVTQSTGPAADVVMDFVSGADRFDLPTAVAAINATVNGGSLSGANFNADLEAAIGAGQLGAGNAVLFKPNAGLFAGATFLIVDANGVAGYQADQDFVMQLAINPVMIAVTDFV